MSNPQIKWGAAVSWQLVSSSRREPAAAFRKTPELRSSGCDPPRAKFVSLVFVASFSKSARVWDNDNGAAGWRLLLPFAASSALNTNQPRCSGCNELVGKSFDCGVACFSLV